MLKTTKILISILMLLFSFSIIHAMVISPPDELEIKAKTFVTNLADGKFDKAVEDFDSTMTSLAPPEKMADVWNDFISQIGKYKKQLSIRSEKIEQYDIYYVTCEFESTKFDIKVVFDPSKKIAGQFFVPPLQIYEFAPPPYADSTSFRETEVTVGTGEWALGGTLTIPVGTGPYPAVVLVHGSGPNDRDETIGPNKPFRDIAQGLASNGIAVLRYDKRTYAYQTKMAEIYDKLTPKEEIVDDAILAAELLREYENIDPEKIYVLGHSLGGTMIPRISTYDSEIAGYIMLAGSPRPLEDLCLEQMMYIMSLDGELNEVDKEKLEEIKDQVINVKSLRMTPDITADKLPMNIPAAYWIYLNGYKPAIEAGKITQPVLILAGQRDYQVTKADYKVWQEVLASNDNFKFKSYLMLNHLFIEGEGTPQPSEYEIPGHVDKTVIDDIVAWMKNPSTGKTSDN